jgi:molybdopterin-dependent oxidoreductase alpha subunit
MVMSRKRPEGIREYDEPAAGWDATIALGKALARERIPIQGVRTLLKNNQPSGFDCPGCAWPDPKHTSAFEFCENGAKAVSWESTARRVGPDFFAKHTVTSLWAQTDHWLEGQGRLTHPVRYDAVSDHFVPVSWDEAFTDIAQRLNAFDTPDEVEFYTSGRASNEAAFLFQLFARHFGTNNFPDCSNMCHEATSVGLPRAIGVGKATVTLEDFDHCDLIFSIGHNPGTNHPRMMTSLREAALRHVPIIVFNPFKERALERFEAPQAPVEMATFNSTRIATHYYQVKVGGDAAALKGICKALLSLDAKAKEQDAAPVLDHDFIQGHTSGFEELAADLEASSWEAIEHVSGLSRLDLTSVAEIYAASTAAIACYGMGITQQITATTNVQQIINLLLLRGNIGRTGAGVCPLRGHSNVQGNRTVGITEKPSAEFLDRLRDVFGFEPPRKHGHSVVESIAAMRDGTSKAVICLGGNLAIAAPDPSACVTAFRKLDLSVSLATKLNRTHLLTGRATYVLPVIGRTEMDIQAGGHQSITVEDMMSMVHASTGFLHPPSAEAKSEPAIISGIAKATLGSRSRVDWDAMTADYDVIRDKIEAVYPDFQGFNERIRVPGGFQLPNTAQQRVWKTASGRATFCITEGLEEGLTILDPSVLKLATMRSHDQYNTTIYSLDDRYRGVFGRRDILFINEQEMTRRGLEEGDVVDVYTALDHASPHRVVQGLTLVRYALPDGCCGGYYPETQPLVALEYFDRDCLTPSYKSIPVTISRAAKRRDSDVVVVHDGVAGKSSASTEVL